MLEKAMHMNVADYRPQTVAEMNDFVLFALTVEKIPEMDAEQKQIRKQKQNPASSYYVGKHEDAKSLFDAIHAEMLGEKELRAEKFMRTHEVRQTGQAVLKDKRKPHFSRKIRYFDRDLDDRFPNKGKSMYMTIQRYRSEIDESLARNDDDIPEHRVGKTTLSRVMNRTYARMQKIAHDFCEKNGYQLGECYAYDPKNHYYHVDYPDEYYRVRSEYMALRDECDERFIRKMQKGEC